MGFDNRRSNRLAPALVFAATIAFALAPIHSASAYTFKVLHRFCAQPTCPDGANPVTALVRDDAGNLYGTTAYGGKYGDVNASTGGTVFELRLTGTGYKFRVLHDFCVQPNCADGENPYGSLILDTNGDLYGTALSGGTGAGGVNNGVAFRLVPNADRTKWKFKILYTFCSQASCADGAQPFGNLTYQGSQSGALYDGTSPLYGTTFGGGSHASGIVFALTGKAHGTESVLYGFCSQKNCDDGQHPEASLLLDAKGDLFGTAAVGGGYDFGTAFELLPGKSGYTEAVLHDFCTTENDFCPDGQEPGSPVVMNATGDLFGSSSSGGAAGEGVVFKLTPETYTVKETVLHTFCLQWPCTGDGAHPSALILDANGNVLGETTIGGRYGGGTIFKLHGTNVSVLYDFCRKSDCPDGEIPSGGLLLDKAGDLFGVAIDGGILTNTEYGGGTVFELVR